ncbi:MAG: hypothetical protein K2R98_16000 [Gemmataceae bacterium]|nr:hypothetical protein [Gemmataceae bacterium]
MPMTVNGIGTSICPARGFVKWGGEADCDSIECFVVAFLPLIPFKAIHTFGWAGNQYRAVPIRWSVGLILRGMLMRWLWGGVVVGLLFGIIMLFADKKRDPAAIICFLTLAFAAGLGILALRWTDRRHKNIRYVLGVHDLGSSDPATWTHDLLENIRPAQEMYGTAGYSHAVEPLLDQGDFSRAMWAARLAVALEDRGNGEQLTDQVLGNPQVQEAIAEVRKNPYSWARVMSPTKG